MNENKLHVAISAVAQWLHFRLFFRPSYWLGLWFNSSFIIRRHLWRCLENAASSINGGTLLDVGCGSKPYKELFSVENYIGVDVEESGHSHRRSEVDLYYDGARLPFGNGVFQYIISIEVIEHVFDSDAFLKELNRCLCDGGTLIISCPFFWNEHEQPYDFARYTSFGIKHCLKKNGFEVENADKYGSAAEVICQLIASYMSQSLLPSNKYLNLAMTPFLIAPFSILGKVLGSFLPKNDSFFLGSLVLARKTKENT